MENIDKGNDDDYDNNDFPIMKTIETAVTTVITTMLIMMVAMVMMMTMMIIMKKAVTVTMADEASAFFAHLQLEVQTKRGLLFLEAAQQN